MAIRDLRFRLLGEDRASGTFDRVADSSERAGGKISKFATGIGTAAGGLAAGGIAAGIGALSSFAGGAVDAFAAVEDATGAAGVQFGEALPQVVKFAEEAGKAFGLSKRAALDAQNEFGTLGKAAGLQGGDLADFSGKLTGLAGDLASFKGTSTEQAIGAVGAALRGENEPLRAYGVLLDDATIKAEAMKLGLIKTTKDALTPQNKTLAVQSAIFKQTKDAQGDYARTSTSTANVQKTLAAATEDAQAKLGAKLAPAMTAVRRGMLQVVLGATKLIENFQGSGKMGETLRGVLDKVKTAFRENRPEIDKVVGALKAMGEFIVTRVIPIFVDFFVARMKVAFSALALLVDAFNAIREPILGVFVAISRAFLDVVGGLVNGAAAAFGWIPGLGPKLKNAAAEFKTFAEKANENLDSIEKDRVIRVRISRIEEGIASGALSGSEGAAATVAALGGGRPRPAPRPAPIVRGRSRDNERVVTIVNLDGKHLTTVVNGVNVKAGRNGALVTP